MNKLTVLNTRSKEQAAELTRLLEQKGIAVIEIPALEIIGPTTWHPLQDTLAKVRDNSWLLCTSVNALRFCHHFLSSIANEQEVQLLKSLPLAVIGKKSAQSAKNHGFNLKFIAQAANAEDFAKEFSAQHCQARAPSKKTPPHIICLRGSVWNSAVAKILRESACKVDEVEVYQSAVPTIDPNLKDQIYQLLTSSINSNQKQQTSSAIIIALTSAEAARNLHKMCEYAYSDKGDLCRNALLSLPVVVLGQKTMEASRQLGFSHILCSNDHSIESLVDVISKHFCPNNSS